MGENVRVTSAFPPFPLVSKAANGSELLGENGSLAPSKPKPDPDPALPPKTGAGVIHHTGFAEGDPFAFAKGEGEANGEAEKAELLVPANAANPPALVPLLKVEVGDEGRVAKAGI